MTGKQYQVSWNSSSDYDLLNPYILADTLGGDTHCERYGFQGGYAVSKGNSNSVLKRFSEQNMNIGMWTRECEVLSQI